MYHCCELRNHSPCPRAPSIPRALLLYLLFKKELRISITLNALAGANATRHKTPYPAYWTSRLALHPIPPIPLINYDTAPARYPIISGMHRCGE